MSVDPKDMELYRKLASREHSRKDIVPYMSILVSIALFFLPAITCFLSIFIVMKSSKTVAIILFIFTLLLSTVGIKIFMFALSKLRTNRNGAG